MIPTSGNPASASMSDRQRVFAILRASSGNLLEWAQFYFYSYCMIYFAPAFFPSNNETIQLLQAAGIFAAGFLARPVGGWFYGRLADKQGRRKALIHSGVVMLIGSLILATSPTYATIGYAAPALLLCARLLQGLSVGGDYGASATYMSEVAIKKQRGFLASFQYTTLIGGQLIALLTIMVLQQLLTTDQLRSWGWRVPFILSSCAALLSIWLRLALQESATQKLNRNKQAGSIRHLLDYKRAFMTVFVTTAAGSLCFYTFTVYMHKYLIKSVGLADTTATWIMAGTLFIAMILQPIFGALSDRIGRLIPMVLFSSAMMLFTLPITYGLKHTSNPYVAFALITIALTILSLYTSIGGLIKAELFPSEVRALGVGLSYAIANALFGGSSEYIALWAKSSGVEGAFYWYITALCACSLIISLRYLPDALKMDYLDRK
jgi:MHS family alpha-ketoglutarate permease-like MFS transporter